MKIPTNSPRLNNQRLSHFILEAPDSEIVLGIVIAVIRTRKHLRFNVSRHPLPHTFSLIPRHPGVRTSNFIPFHTSEILNRSSDSDPRSRWIMAAFEPFAFATRYGDGDYIWVRNLFLSLYAHRWNIIGLIVCNYVNCKFIRNVKQSQRDSKNVISLFSFVQLIIIDISS